MSDFRPDIWRLQAQLNTQGLVDALSNSDAGVRKRAAAALRALGAVNTIPALKAALENEQEPDTRANILAALDALQQELERKQTRIDDTSEEKSVASELGKWVAQLKSDKDEQVIEAAKALGEMGAKEAVEPLVIQFNNPKVSIKVRLAVAEALLKLESAPVEVALLGALRSAEWRVRRNGAAILGQLRADWAVEPLTKALRDANDVVRRTAYAALKHIGTPDALKVLESVPKPPPESPDKPKTGGLLARAQAPNNSTAPTEASEGDDASKIAWPKRKKEDIDPKLAQTRELNPSVLDEAKARFEQLKRESSDDKKP